MQAVDEMRKFQERHIAALTETLESLNGTIDILNNELKLLMDR